jgi:hypothetical protein
MKRKCKYSIIEFIERSNNIHSNMYLYDDVVFAKTTDKVKILCKKHGFFEQKVIEHLSGKGCRKCYYESRKSSLSEFIKKSNLIYNNSFNYDKFQYVDSKTESIITCKMGHEFYRTPNRHHSGKDFCNQCRVDSYIIDKLSKIDFTGFEYLDWNGEKVNIKCNKCNNVFNRKISAHLKLKNCPICNPNKDTKENFIEKSINVHGYKYDYSKIDYISSKHKVNLICEKGHEISQKANNHLRGTGCPKCNRFNKKEYLVMNFIEENYKGEIIQSDRTILNGKEIDIYLPELNLAFEFNGLYWHSELYKERIYHLNKTKECLEKGIQLIHIWEDDWDYKHEIVKSIILNKLGKSKRIFARKCEIKTPDNKEVRDFLVKNHIQGFVGSKVKIGLYFEGELVSLMTFGNLRKSLGQNSKEDSYELLRFCNKLGYSVVGGAGKLFKFFFRSYKVKEIISYSDNSRGIGNLYKQLGFELVSETVPNYYWIVDGIRKHRFNYRKDKLIKEGNDSNKTEVQIMNDKGYNRIFDCGSKKWIFKNIKQIN